MKSDRKIRNINTPEELNDTVRRFAIVDLECQRRRCFGYPKPLGSVRLMAEAGRDVMDVRSPISILWYDPMVMVGDLPTIPLRYKWPK